MNMKKFLFALMAITVAFASCQKDDNDGGNDNGGNGNEGGGNGSDTEQTVTLEDLTSGMLVINGEQTPLTGIFVDEYSGYMMVTMTDVAGAESFAWLVENEAEYVQILVLPSLCNREFDVKTETDGFALYSTYASAPLVEGAGPGFTEAIESGSCRCDCDGTNAEAFINRKLADGSTIANVDLSVTDDGTDEEDGMGSNISSFAVDAAGNLYVTDYNYIYVLDAEGKLLFKIDDSQYSGSLCRLQPDQVGILWYNYATDTAESTDENGQFFIPVDLETKTWGEKIKMPANVWNVYPGDDAYDFYYKNNDNIYGYTFASDTKDKLVDWMACDVDTSNMYDSGMLSDGRVVGMRKDWGRDTPTYQLNVLHRMDASEVKEKTSLTLACMGLDWSLRSKIVEYNKSNDQYRIQVVDYSEYATDDDYNAGITKLTTEIISGSVPDIFLTSNLPIDKYAAKGVIADLNTFMDGGNGLSRDYFVPQVMSALEKDGKLYELPTSFSVQTAYALSSIASQYDTWNVAAVQDAMTQLQEGATVFSNGWTKNMALSNCLSRNLSAFVDWTTGKCEFDSEAFQQLLAFCNSFPDDSSSDDGIAYSSEAATVDTMDDPVWESDATRILSGKQLMATTSFYSFEDYIYNIYPVKDKVTFVGYPSESGEPGNSFYIQCPMAISSVTKYPDAAWDFVSTMIRQTNEDAESMYAFPISQEAFDKKMTAVMTEQYQLDVNGEQVDWDEDGEPDKMCIGTYEVVENGESTWQQVYALTQEDVDQILSVINSATGIVDYDDEILSIVSDEVSAYFAGDKDVQTTANMIQSRVNLYVQEQR